MNKPEGKFIESCKHYERYLNTPSSVAQNLYYYPQWLGCFVCKPDFYIHRHHYQSILLLHTFHGSGKLQYRDREYILGEESIALINCMEPHTYFPTDDNDWSFYFIHFSGMQSTQLFELIYELGEGCVFPSNNIIENDIRKCIQYIKEKAGAAEVLLSKLLSNILHELILNVQQKEQNQISMICDYIADNCTQPLTTEMLARLSGFSRCYFATLFKKYTGTTLHDYLLCYRLDQAKILLLESQLTVNEIAERSGFHDTGTFIRAFKKKERLTPLQFRKSFGRDCKKDIKKNPSGEKDEFVDYDCVSSAVSLR